MLLIKEFDLILCSHNHVIGKLNFIILRHKKDYQYVYLKRLRLGEESQSNFPYYLRHSVNKYRSTLI